MRERERRLRVAAVVLLVVLTVGYALFPGLAARGESPPDAGIAPAADGGGQAYTQDDVSQMWTWLGLGGEGEAGTAAAFPITSYTYDPYVLQVGATEQVSLTVQTDGSATSLVAALWCGDTMTKTLAGDVCTFDLTAEQILHGYDPDYARNAFGYLNVYTSAGLQGRLNLVANVSNEQVPPVTPLSLAPDVQAGPHVVNLLVPGALSASAATLIRGMYAHYADDFDFVNVVWVDHRVLNRGHGAVANQVQGIGRPLFDYATLYGSDGRLRGFVLYPVSTFFDGAEWGYQHELGHQWINFVLPGAPHWPVSEMAQGIMGFNIPGSAVGGELGWRFTANLDGTYTVHRYPNHLWEVGFCDLDLYLMGLLAPAEVQPAVVFSDGSVYYQFQEGAIIDSPTYLADAQTIVDAVGPRVPDASSAPRDFDVATIVLTQDRLLTPAELAFFDYMAARAELREAVPCAVGLSRLMSKPWYLSTRTLSTLKTRMRPDGQRLPGDVDGDCDVDVVDIMLVAGRWLTQAGDADYVWYYDLDGDGDIDILDIMLVAGQWGERCGG